MSGGTAGTVFDIGYQAYGGPREGRRRAFIAIFGNGVRTAFGVGRGMRAKLVPWTFIMLLSTIGLVMALIAGAADRLVGAGAAQQLNLPSHADYYGIASMILFVFAAVVAPELLCRDRKERVTTLYLVRPITGSDYVAARWTAFFVVMLAAAWLPQFILLTGLVMGDPDPLGYLRANWLDVPRFLGAGVAIAAYATTLALLTASFTTRRAYASVFLVGLFLVTTSFTNGLGSQVGGVAGRWISMFNLNNIPIHVNDIIFGEATGLTRNSPAGEFSEALRVAWYAAWVLVPGAVLWLRYRRMEP
jgi:ABC-2 type transport system permease protein